MLVNPIQQNFGCSRMSISRKLPKDFRKALRNSKELKEIAKTKDVYLKFSEIQSFPSSVMVSISKRGIDHVTDVPEYALKNDTGDSIYISWQKNIIEKSLSANLEETVNTIKNYLNVK